MSDTTQLVWSKGLRKDFTSSAWFCSEIDSVKGCRIAQKIGKEPLTSEEIRFVMRDARQCLLMDDVPGYIDRLECLLSDARLTR